MPDKPEETKDELSPERLLKKLKANVAKRLLGGDTGLAAEIERIHQLERRLSAGTADEPEDGGIPERLKVTRRRRNYTLSDKALEQRRGNAQKINEAGLQTGPTSDEGRAASAKNAFKHGLYAQSFFNSFKKPCKSTCDKFPCSLVDESQTEPGQECLDRMHVYEAFTAIRSAVMDGSYDEFNGIAALEIAKSVEVLRYLLDDILEDGTVLKSEKMNADGKIIGYEYKPHPSLLSIQKLIETLGFTPRDMMITPKEIKRAGHDDAGMKTIADLMSGVGGRVKEALEHKAKTIPDKSGSTRTEPE